MHWAKQHPGLCHAISIPSFKIQTCRRINCIPETMAQIYLGIETFPVVCYGYRWQGWI